MLSLNFHVHALCSGVGRCFWAGGLIVVWGRWSPPILRGVCGVCIPTPARKIWIFAHSSTVHQLWCNFMPFQFTKVYSTHITKFSHKQNSIWLGMTIFTRYIARLWPIIKRCDNTQRHACDIRGGLYSSMHACRSGSPIATGPDL